MGGKLVDYERMAELNASGMSTAELAKAIGCHTRTVTRWRSGNHPTQLTQYQAIPVRPERLESARRLLDDGASFSEVRRTLGMTFRTLHRHFPGMGWSSLEGSRLGAFITKMQREV